MAAWTQIVNFIVSRFWPWFIKFVWPIIQTQIVELVSFLTGKMAEILKDFFSEKTKHRSEEAEQKAKEAEREADSAKDNAEAEKFRAVAQVWREVAEQFRRDNDELKRKLEEVHAMSEEASKHMVADMTIDADFSKHKPVFKMNGKATELPSISQ